MRLALFTLEAAVASAAVLRFAQRHAADLVLVGWSSPWRAHRAAWRAVRGGGLGVLPYLAVNHVVPVVGSFWRRPARLSGLCGARGVRVLRLGDGAAMRAALREAGAELLVSFHLDRVLDAETLAVLPRGGINVHASLLPRHRGPVPAFHGLAEGVTGVSVHALAPRIDAGGIWAQRAVEVPAGVSASAAARLLHATALPLLDGVIARIAAGEAPPPPPEALPYCGWPDAAARRAAGVRLLGPGDLGAAWRAPAGGWHG